MSGQISALIALAQDGFRMRESSIYRAAEEVALI